MASTTHDDERGVLSCLLQGADPLPAFQDLTGRDFSDKLHQRLFAEIKWMIEEGEALILTAIVDRLKLDDVEAAILAALLDRLLVIRKPGELASYVRRVRRAARERDVKVICDEVARANGDATGLILDLKTKLEKYLEPSHDDQIKVVTGEELLKMNVKSREFLIDGLIPAKSMSEIFAWRGVGKTWLALTIAHASAVGGQCLKWKAPRPRPVLFVDGELDAATLQQRIKALDATASKSADGLKLLCCDLQEDPFPHLATRRAQALIEGVLGDCELLVLDNLSALAPSGNESEGEDWIAIQSWLLELRRNGVASLFLHHAGHAGHARGTTRREDLLDLVLELRRPKDYVASEGLRFEIHFTKTRGMLAAGAEPVEARLGTDLISGNPAWTWRDLEDVRAKQVQELREAGHSLREIESLTGIPRSTADRLTRKTHVGP